MCCWPRLDSGFKYRVCPEVNGEVYHQAPWGGVGEGGRSHVPAKGAVGLVLQHKEPLVTLPHPMENWGSRSSIYSLFCVYWEPTACSAVYELAGAVLRATRTGKEPQESCPLGTTWGRWQGTPIHPSKPSSSITSSVKHSCFSATMF